MTTPKDRAPRLSLGTASTLTGAATRRWSELPRTARDTMTALGLDGSGGRPFRDDPSSTKDAHTDIQRRVAELLDGDDERGSQAARARPEAADTRIDATTLTLLRRTGTDPAVASALVHLVRDIRSDRNDRHRDTTGGVDLEIKTTRPSGLAADISLALDHDGVLRAGIPLSHDAWWSDVPGRDRPARPLLRLVVGRPFPLALAASMAGRPLARIVSHPLLDTLPLTVVEATVERGQTALRLSGHAPMLLRLATLPPAETGVDRPGTADQVAA